MSTSLLRQSRLAAAIDTPEAHRLYDISRRAAHAHPRRNSVLQNNFRRLRRMAKEAGVWYPGLGEED
jgi:hypothetical protein